VILAVGVLERHKGHRVLLESLADLARSGFQTPWKLIIAGGAGGTEHQSLLDYIRAEGLGSRVSIVTNRNDVSDLLALAHVFVMPSLWEGLPMALLEAMTAGKTIIASRTAGIPEAVVDGREGILVPPGEVAPLAAALRLVLTDSARSHAMARAAVERAASEFTVQVMADRYETLYANAWFMRRGRLLTA
jgi:glycosyltransferase involved in cell wall biosynthesis